jgi:hypothetical protein
MKKGEVKISTLTLRKNVNEAKKSRKRLTIDEWSCLASNVKGSNYIYNEFANVIECQGIYFHRSRTSFLNHFKLHGLTKNCLLLLSVSQAKTLERFL